MMRRQIDTSAVCVGVPLLLSGLLSPHTQGEWFPQSSWVTLGVFGFVVSVGLAAATMWDPGIAGQRYWWNSRTRRWVEHFEPGWVF